MKKIIYNLVAKSLKVIFGTLVVRKKLKGIDAFLFYEVGQHLSFILQKEISYEPVIQSKISRYVKPGDLIFDVGANIGQYAIMFSKLVGKNGKVVSFEPDRSNFSFLMLNKIYNYCENIECVNIGVGEEDGKLVFYRDSDTGGRRSSFKREFVGSNFHGEQFEIGVQKIDTLVDRYGVPNFIKIDVEGFEDKVVQGFSGQLNSTAFIIEVRRETKAVVFDFFKARNFDCLMVDEEKDKVINTVEEIPDFCNLVFTKKQLS